MTCFEPMRLMNPIPFNMSGIAGCGSSFFMSRSLFLSASLFVVKLCRISDVVGPVYRKYQENKSVELDRDIRWTSDRQ